MGAAASIPDELTQEEAIKLAGDKWDEKLLALWPAGADKVTKEQLITIIKDVPIFAKKSVDESGNWDETAVNGQTKSIEEVLASAPDATAPVGGAAKPAAAKVVTAPRDKHDMALRRAQKLAEQNNLTVEEVMAMQTQSSSTDGESGTAEPGAKTPAPKPPRAPSGAKSKSRQQSEELRSLMRAQRKAAMSEGRPPSRSIEDVECQLFVRPASHSDAPQEPQVFVVDGTDSEPQVLVIGPESDA